MTSTTKTKTEPTASMADQLRSAIAKSGRSFYELGAEAGVHPVQVSRFAKGERDLRLESASRLAGVLGLRLTSRRS